MYIHIIYMRYICVYVSYMYIHIIYMRYMCIYHICIYHTCMYISYIWDIHVYIMCMIYICTHIYICVYIYIYIIIIDFHWCMIKTTTASLWSNYPSIKTNSSPKAAGWDTQFLRHKSIVSFFAWEDNKAILFHFTQKNSVSDIWFGTGAQRLSF